MNEVISKDFKKFVSWKSFKDLIEIKNEFFKLYDYLYWYYIIMFFDENDLKLFFN